MLLVFSHQHQVDSCTSSFSCMLEIKDSKQSTTGDTIPVPFPTLGMELTVGAVRRDPELHTPLLHLLLASKQLSFKTLILYSPGYEKSTLLDCS